MANHAAVRRRTVEPPHSGDVARRAIHRSGAFRKFQDAICRLGIEELVSFSKSAFEEIAREWLEASICPTNREGSSSLSLSQEEAVA